MLQPFLHREKPEIENLNELIENMKETKKNPGLKEICMSDQLVREFGFSLMEKLGTTEEQIKTYPDNIRTKQVCWKAVENVKPKKNYPSRFDRLYTTH